MQNPSLTYFPSLRMQTYFRLSLVSAKNNVCEPQPGNDFCDVGILSQSQFSSSSPRTTSQGICCDEHSSFILSWNLIGQGETKVITSQKSFPGSGSQTLFSAETSDSRKYVCVCRLMLSLTRQPLNKMRKTTVTCKHANNRQKDFFYRLDRTPSFCTTLITHGVITRGMQDGYTHSTIRIN